MAEPFLILRSAGEFRAGGYRDSKSEILTYGTVSVASQKEIEMLPEADRVNEVRIFHTADFIRVTTEDDQDNGVSDILVWRNVQYRVLRLLDQSQRGYHAALATRMAGN